MKFLWHILQKSLTNMNWYKIAQLDNDWWVRFYDHLSNTADFVLKDAGIVFYPKESVIKDGRNVNFIFNAILNNESYACRIQLQFLNIVQLSTFEENSAGTLKSVSNQYSQKLLRADVAIITNSQLINSQIFQSQNAIPATMMNFIRDSIIGHQETEQESYDDGYGNDGDYV